MSLTSVVIPTYNGWDFTEQLLAQLVPLPDAALDVVVVDDKSELDLSGKVARRFPHVRFVTRSVNGGFARAVNEGVAATRGEVLAVLNNDLIVSAAQLRVLVDLARADHDLVVSPRLAYPDGRPAKVAHRFPTATRDARDMFVPTRVLRRVAAGRGPSSEEQGLVPTDWVTGACLVFHRSVWERVGPLDVDYRMYSEEVDWQRRARAVGVRSAVAEAVTVVHDESQGAAASHEAQLRRLGQVWRSRVRYHELHSAPRELRRLRALSKVALTQVPLLRVAALAPRLRSVAEYERARVDVIRRALVQR
ncbi:glycosyltransferase family 2 protein [Vallicoccus soli]|uniref:Glycosyltransferase family 2 protein n=1 Tax=Vallicoccus soli TaxID=2339232 RepID=A0A3A3ZN24_9ACTN|nr:glycosyltransferase family 2 protein [Vallicoccus soli]RJK98181.1 glycosyltransferase family 2 protein [Vallicoccus soli]